MVAKKYNKPVLCFAGSVLKGAEECNNKGIDSIFSILHSVTTLEEAMKTENAMQNMRDSVEQVLRVLKIK